jgi:hypothetical protein
MPHAPCLAMVLATAAQAARAGPPTVPAVPDDPARLLGIVISGEPSIDEVQRAAAARAAPPAEQTDGWRRRARLAPLVPKLVAEYRHDSRAYRVVGLTSSSEVDYLREMPSDTVTVRLAWDLERLVFGRAELDVVAAAEHAEVKRRAAVKRATRLYFDRLRLKLELVAAPPAGVERARMELELEALTSELRALTGLGVESAP